MEWEGQMITVPKAQYVIHEPEAKVVRYFFDLALKRTPIRRIAIMLTEMGVPTPDGKSLWRPATIHGLLTHQGYTGQAYAWKYHFEYIPGQGMRRTLNDKSKWVSVEGCIPPLISLDTFEHVQEYLAYNKANSPRNNKNPFDSLCRSGLAICGYCGCKLAVQRDKRRNYISYACYVGKEGYQKCRGVSARVHTVDRIAWEKAVEVIKTPSLIEEELRKRRIEDPTKGSLRAAETLLKDLVQAIINLTQALEHTTDPTTIGILTHRLEELAKQKQAYEQQYDEVMRYRINWEDAMRALDDFKAWCDKVRPHLTDPGFEPTYQEKRDALEIIGIKVAVFGMERQERFKVDVEPPDVVSKFRIVSKSSSASLSWCFCPRRLAR
jgi:hypothetical protein